METPLTTSPLGILGTYYATRHNLGQYRSDAVTASYRFKTAGLSDPATWLRDALANALARTILQLPVLRHGVAGQSSRCSPGFFSHNKIHLDAILTLLPSLENDLACSPRTPDDVLSKVLGSLHERLFADGTVAPSWHLYVYEHPEQDQGKTIDLVFLAHHALVDGLSGMAFQQKFAINLQAVSHGNEETAKWPLEFSCDTPPPVSPDSVVKLQSVVYSIPPLTPKTWSGSEIPSLSSTLSNFKSNVSFVHVSPETLVMLLGECRARVITLSGLIHGIILSYLSRSVKLCNPPEASTFTYLTPYSLRPWTGASAEDIVNHISFIKTVYTASQAAAMAATKTNSADEKRLIIEVALDFRSQMAHETARFPEDNAWCSLLGIDDMVAHCGSQVGQDRGATYEMSNIGVAKFDGYEDGERLQLNHLTFSQAGMVTGPPIGVNVVSTRGRGARITVCWATGALDEPVIEGLVLWLEKRLSKFTPFSS